MPKIISGSSTMLEIKPHIILSMETFILPTDWKIFSSEIPSMMMTENTNTRLA